MSRRVAPHARNTNARASTQHSKTAKVAPIPTAATFQASIRTTPNIKGRTPGSVRPIFQVVSPKRGTSLGAVYPLHQQPNTEPDLLHRLDLARGHPEETQWAPTRLHRRLSILKCLNNTRLRFSPFLESPC